VLLLLKFLSVVVVVVDVINSNVEWLIVWELLGGN